MQKLGCERLNEMMGNICCYGRIGDSGLIECSERDNGAIGATEGSVTGATTTVTGVAGLWRPDIAHYLFKIP